MFYKKVRPCHLEFRYICARILGAPDMTVINTGIGIVRRTAARCCKIKRFERENLGSHFCTTLLRRYVN